MVFLIWLGIVNVHHLQHQSGLHEVFCAIQKRGFLTCILCCKLQSKLEFYQKFQVNSLLSFRAKHFSCGCNRTSCNNEQFAASAGQGFFRRAKKRALAFNVKVPNLFKIYVTVILYVTCHKIVTCSCAPS